VSDVDLKELDSLSRDELIARAAALGVTRPELLTRVELRDEIVRLAETDEAKRQRARGWLGVARDLVASVVEQRLNLPDAADLIRGVNVLMPKHVPPVATVTLAEIYAAQGHVKRAMKMLDEVLKGEPEHEAARELLQSLKAQMQPEPTPSVAEPAEDAEELQECETEAVTLDASANEPEIDVPLSEAPEAEAPSVVAESLPEVVAEQTAAQPVESLEERTKAIEPLPEVVAEQTVAQPVESLEERTKAVEPEVTLLLYRRSGKSVVCHWCVDELVWNEWSALGNGQFIVRMVKVTPSLLAIEPVQSDIPLPGTSGEVMFNDISVKEQVRLALGWEGGGKFTPVAIGVEIAGDHEDDVQLAWVPFYAPVDPPHDVWLRVARRYWQKLAVGSDS